MNTIRKIGQLLVITSLLGLTSCNDDCSDSTKNGESPDVPSLYKVSTLRFLNQSNDTIKFTGPYLSIVSDQISDYSGGCGNVVNLKSHFVYYYGASNISWKNTGEFKDGTLYAFARVQYGDYSFTVYPDISLNVPSDENTLYTKYPSITLRGKVHHQVTEIRTSVWHYVSNYRHDSAAIFLSGDTLLRIVDYGSSKVLDWAN